MNITEALYAAGVRENTLTADEKLSLDTQGFLHLPAVLSTEQIDTLRRRQDELLAAEGDSAGTEVHQEQGTDRLSDLINKGPMYHVVLSETRVLAAVAHVLNGDLKLSSLNSRSALPGQGLQGLHPDWERLQTPGDYQVCNSIWLLDDFTEENGATRVVPGTHLSGKMPGDEMADAAAPHPNEVLILGKAGDVVVFNSHLWHGGTRNQTDRPRRAMHGYFTRRANPPQLDQQKYLRRVTWLQLNEAQRAILGVTAPPE